MGGCLSKQHPLLEDSLGGSISRDVIPQAKLEEMIKNIPDHKVMKNKSPVWSISGPDEKQEEYSFKDICIGRSVSTYPTYSDGSRYGDPIADTYSACGYENSIFAVVCDGCGWGEKSKRAATVACKSFSQYVEDNISKVDTINSSAILILKALEKAHIKIMEGGSPLEVGSTTLTGGLLLKQEDGNWGFVCCNIGVAKAFHWSVSTQKVTAITGNRRNPADPTDPGGRIGSNAGKPDPELQNLGVYYFPCQSRDIIFILSDGVHDNLDPQQLGKTPEEMNIHAKDWIEAHRNFPKETEAAKNVHSNGLLRDLILNESNELTPKNMSDSIIQYCFQITKNQREYMESNPKAKQPDDQLKFPGKLDHTTVIAFIVGNS